MPLCLQALLLLDADFVASPTMLAPYKTPQVRGQSFCFSRAGMPEYDDGACDPQSRHELGSTAAAPALSRLACVLSVC